jgi:hydroxymethylbilane synthase
VVREELLALRAVVLDPAGRQRITAEASGPASDPERLGRELAERLLDQGARALLAPAG